MMRVLIGCEESGVLRDAFAALGHDSASCDTKPSRGAPHGTHYRMDIVECLETQGWWDLIILHPPCDALATSGNAFYGEYKKWNHKRLEAIKWTKNLVKLARTKTPRLCVENPRSVIFQYLNYDRFQWIHPWQFGHDEAKETGLALWNLPQLIPTIPTKPAIVHERVRYMGGGVVRKRERSKTYEGVAAAIAEQWGNL